MSRASELAIDMRSAVQTYPQMSEDEPGGYCTQADQLMDEVADELERLERVNAELVEALREAIDIAWVEDSHAASFDSTVIFSPYYDFSSLDGIGRIEFLGKYDCIVWPARGVAGGKWSAYCTYEGSLWFEKFDTAADAKEACMCLLDKVLPDHPAMRARAALTSATKEQQK